MLACSEFWSLCAFNFIPGGPQPAPPIALPTPSQKGLSKEFGTGLLSIFSLKNPPKCSRLPPKAHKKAAKKEPRVTQMNYSGLSNFTQKPISTLL